MHCIMLVTKVGARQLPQVQLLQLAAIASERCSHGAQRLTKGLRHHHDRATNHHHVACNLGDQFLNR